MKYLKYILGTAILGGALTLTGISQAADQSPSTRDKKAKDYPLNTCIVSGEKLGEMGKPYVFVHDGQEFKLCCKSCLKDFNKEPAKYVKKLADAQKGSKAKAAAPAQAHSGHADHQH